MKFFLQRQLANELRAAGAAESEARELLSIAADLRRLEYPGKTAASKSGSRLVAIRPAGLVFTGAFIGVALIVAAQSVMPTSWLFPVQQLTDSAAVLIHPQYRANIMMKRARQVNELVAGRAPDSAVMATLAEYDHDARAYKTMPRADYAAIEFCETNLNQAAVSATPQIRRAITDSLNSLRTT